MKRWAPWVLLALALAGILFGLRRFPALTEDEAWVGLFARSLGTRGFFSPHEMNSYTGALYGLLLSLSFKLLGLGVLALRLPGAVFNAFALVLMFAHLRRRIGADAAAWWALLAAESSYFLMKSRVAWEVYALQPLLLTLLVMLLDRPAGRARTALFAFVVLIGVQNHFIFLSVPLSLSLLYLLRKDKSATPAFAALAAAAVVFLVKPRLSEAGWPDQRLWVIPLFLALPLVAALAPLRPPPRLSPRVHGWIVRVLGWGAVATMIWHGPALVQALAGPVVWKRMLSWEAPWFLSIPLHVWGFFLLALVAWRATRAWHGREALKPHELTLALWPAAYAAIFMIFRHTSSLRYYAIMHWLCLPAAALGLSRLPRPDRRLAAALGAVALLATQTVLWKEIAHPQERRPLRFHIGWRHENSWDFARKEALFAADDASGACEMVQGNSFVDLPLFFHRAERGGSCDHRLAFHGDYCRECTVPPFHRWNVVKAPN